MMYANKTPKFSTVYNAESIVPRMLQKKIDGMKTFDLSRFLRKKTLLIQLIQMWFIINKNWKLPIIADFAEEQRRD